MKEYDKEEIEMRASLAQMPIPRPISEQEMDVALDFFHAYCDFRAQLGLPVPQWDEKLADIAYQSACRCNQGEVLCHRTSIPANEWGKYSDVLQYSNWKMSGPDGVSRWSKSDGGHREQLQCITTTKAGTGAYCENGNWNYAIVYDFDKTNQTSNEEINSRNECGRSI